jgi:glycosyltransferase involved in cell wall biosynthesis
MAVRYGGIPEAIRQSAAAARSLGHEVEIVTTNADGRSVIGPGHGRPSEWEGLTVAFHPIDRPRRFLTSWSMLRDLRRRLPSFDVVHVHAFYRFHSIAIALASLGPGRPPYVIQPHGSFNVWHRRRRRVGKDVYHFAIEDRIINRSAGMICTSTREADAVRALGYRTRLWTIPLAVDIAQLRAPVDPSDLMARIGVPPDAQLVTFVGRITQKKGVDLLVDAFRTVAPQMPNTHLVLAGPDDEGIGAAAMQRIEAAGLVDRVTFPGTVVGRDKRALLQRSQVFVLPSADESFGMAVAEAMAVGCPVVVSTSVAIQDAVRSAGAGIVADRTAGAIAAAIFTILSVPGEAEAMRSAARQASDASFSLARLATDLDSMYRDVVGA